MNERYKKTMVPKQWITVYIQRLGFAEPRLLHNICMPMASGH